LTANMQSLPIEESEYPSSPTYTFDSPKCAPNSCFRSAMKALSSHFQAVKLKTSERL